MSSKMKWTSMLYQWKLCLNKANKALLWSTFTSINEEFINKNTEFCIQHGNENDPFVYILYAEYSDIWKSA